jgi:hypothetical protein
MFPTSLPFLCGGSPEVLLVHIMINIIIIIEPSSPGALLPLLDSVNVD